MKWVVLLLSLLSLGGCGECPVCPCLDRVEELEDQVAIVDSQLASVLGLKSIGSKSSSWVPRLYFKASDGLYYTVEASTTQARIYREGSLLRTITVVAEASSQSWSRGVSRQGDYIFIPVASSVSLYSCSVVNVTDNSITTYEVDTFDVGGPPMAAYGVVDTVYDPITGDVFMSVGAFLGRTGVLSVFNRIAKLGLTEVEKFVYLKNGILPTGNYFRNVKLGILGSELLWYGEDDDGEYFYGKVDTSETEASSLTQITKSSSSAYKFNSHGPFGLHFRGGTATLYNAEETVLWNLTGYVDTTRYVWTVVRKNDSGDNYRILTRNSSGIAYYLNLASDTTVTELGSKPLGSNTLTCYKPLWDQQIEGIYPKTVVLGDKCSAVYLAVDPWKDVF
jgi:hypothetical protein